MKRVVFETLFRGKLQVEIWRYKREVLALEPEDSKRQILGRMVF